MWLFFFVVIRFIFAESFYSVSEGDSEVLLRVVKQGFVSSNASVLFYTVEGSASSVSKLCNWVHGGGGRQTVTLPAEMLKLRFLLLTDKIKCL